MDHVLARRFKSKNRPSLPDLGRMLAHILPPICSLEPFHAPFLDPQSRPIWKPLWPQIQILTNNLLSDRQHRTRPGVPIYLWTARQPEEKSGQLPPSPEP